MLNLFFKERNMDILTINRWIEMISIIGVEDENKKQGK